jgi:hypothetical protein
VSLAQSINKRPLKSEVKQHRLGDLGQRQSCTLGRRQGGKKKGKEERKKFVRLSLLVRGKTFSKSWTANAGLEIHSLLYTYLQPYPIEI